MKIRLLLAQEDEKTLSGLAEYFSSSPDYELVGTTRNGREAVTLFERFRPDAFVLGVLLPSCAICCWKNAPSSTTNTKRANANAYITCQWNF